ncbi:MAG TPA: cyclase family protein [Miltoncostaeaceae bacterium]|nr:cyclase family protein [Miltoncostaeaceae bacterium]
MPSPAADREPIDREGFEALFRQVCTWGHWGSRSPQGALNHLTPDRIAAAARLVRSGTTVSLGLPVADHRMTMLPDADGGVGGLQFAKDCVALDYHSEGHSHVDAFSHVVYDGALYDGRPGSAVTADGAAAGAIDVLKDGLVGRGVLLDVPGVRDVRWLEPGEDVVTGDLEAAERRQGVRVGPGDILLIRTGHTLRMAEVGPWDTVAGTAGLHPHAVLFLAERQVAALGSDGNNDTAPSAAEGVAFPIHVLALNAMGVHLLDYLQLDDLLARCREAGRWDFLIVAAPLRIEGGTGSPVNPIAVL